jgi:hypothetical protein
VSWGALLIGGIVTLLSSRAGATDAAFGLFAFGSIVALWWVVKNVVEQRRRDAERLERLLPPWPASDRHEVLPNSP